LQEDAAKHLVVEDVVDGAGAVLESMEASTKQKDLEIFLTLQQIVPF